MQCVVAQTGQTHRYVRPRQWDTSDMLFIQFEKFLEAFKKG